MRKSNSLMLYIKGLGNVPSFKNTKSIRRNRRTGKPFIATAPKKADWMEKAIQSIQSQLCCAYQMDEDVISTGLSLQSWIASFVPLDDSVEWIKSETIDYIECDSGDAGATIYIHMFKNVCYWRNLYRT